MSNVRPSDISGIVLAGAFNDSKVEAATMFVTGYLAAQNADWDTEFSWFEFAQWVDNDSAQYVSELYVGMKKMFGAQQIIVNQIHRIIGKYIARRDDSDGNTYFKMTPELSTLVQRFAARRMTPLV